MSPRLSRISVLEQVPLFEGGDVRQTLGDLVRLGRGLEESGYHRLWLAEHHSTGSFLSSAPDLLMMHILDATGRIRVGSGGVMAMHYGSLQMAERFATLATLHPGRVSPNRPGTFDAVGGRDPVPVRVRGPRWEDGGMSRCLLVLLRSSGPGRSVLAGPHHHRAPGQEKP